MNRKRVEQFLQVFFQLGDCDFTKRGASRDADPADAGGAVRLRRGGSGPQAGAHPHRRPVPRALRGGDTPRSSPPDLQDRLRESQGRKRVLPALRFHHPRCVTTLPVLAHLRSLALQPPLNRFFEGLPSYLGWMLPRRSRLLHQACQDGPSSRPGKETLDRHQQLGGREGALRSGDREPTAPPDSRGMQPRREVQNRERGRDLRLQFLQQVRPQNAFHSQTADEEVTPGQRKKVTRRQHSRLQSRRNDLRDEGH